MVNFIAALQTLINFLMKMAGVKAHLVEIMPGTVINFWVPSKTLKNPENDKTIPTTETNINFTKPNKPVVVLIHGFTATVVAITDSINEAILQSLGIGSFSEALLPTSVDGLKKLFSIGTYKKLWLPEKLYMDYLEALFNNRKERDELLYGMIVSDKDTTIPNFKQKIHLIWGEEDQNFKFELAKNMKMQLGDLATYQGIEKAGHLVHLEKPFAFNKRLKQFLHSLQEIEAQ
ncbi:AB hydrolase-1 domain-containing protein [Heracleum sosnowskyi]|uniref:AB hydrolase-1 domain-containing protein n=1 Tax=Heracleum sosnowskyi TaxID=360622 RepID=A0AAD8HCH7_9APIA|nr:AB hydrolase-1 domain-containing protein [Heracleum sosnowskyi]